MLRIRNLQQLNTNSRYLQLLNRIQNYLKNEILKICKTNANIVIINNLQHMVFNIHSVLNSLEIDRGRTTFH